MKKDLKKLTLCRETLVGLDAPGNRSGLAAVLGGAAGTASHTLLKEDCCISKTH